ncbi:mitochondrial amino-acid acetyltransferase [Pluteus cervinus]|uniref:Mitochondrial amino-acid acetyltransferase n=1 Tax=Pluteus cervinus TaxID=181527 RepID=A0ACD3BHT0_9AGAR|nr:mitochondrial amino-acid acetyltransferase [Pluteus cervinus]
MISHSSSSRHFVAAALSTKRRQTFQAFYATIRGMRNGHEPEEAPPSDNDFIMSILRAKPSLRDAKGYLSSLGIRTKIEPPISSPPAAIPQADIGKNAPSIQTDIVTAQEAPKPAPIVVHILNPVHRRTALVKIQGPFKHHQLDSIAKGLVYLEKLGLVSVIVIENDDQPRGEQGERNAIIEDTMRIVTSLEQHGVRARPVLGAVVRLGPKPGEAASPQEGFVPPEAHTIPSDLVPIRSALRAGEIPVIPPFALDSHCRSVRVDSNDVIAALARGMVEASASHPQHLTDASPENLGDIDLTPLRLMVINREGGVPSYARSGYPHLLINLTSEHSHIEETFRDEWLHSHPTALANLNLAKTCLAYMPPTSSAIMVSHRSSSSLIANLITNKPVVSSSLPHALLQGNRKLTHTTPTLLRRGLPVQVIRSTSELDKAKLTNLLEQSFGKKLEAKPFYDHLEKTLDFVIIAGDYVGAAIVTNEPTPHDSAPISYLDKFAVLPSHQGDGTVDFLWVALHDESYGLGHPFAANPNGGRGGEGEGRDLVWRSRANNPINKWYFERSSGHFRMGDWVLFWCDAESRLKVEEGRRGSAGLPYIADWEEGRLSNWSDVVAKIPSCWRK